MHYLKAVQISYKILENLASSILDLLSSLKLFKGFIADIWFRMVTTSFFCVSKQQIQGLTIININFLSMLHDSNRLAVFLLVSYVHRSFTYWDLAGEHPIAGHTLWMGESSEGCHKSTLDTYVALGNTGHQANSKSVGPGCKLCLHESIASIGQIWIIMTRIHSSQTVLKIPWILL